MLCFCEKLVIVKIMAILCYASDRRSTVSYCKRLMIRWIVLGIIMEKKVKKQNKHVIAVVQDGSIAQELELVPGDVLLTVNGQPVEDIFDYRYLMNEEYED